MHDWTAADPEHVVALHCKAGKGRTGLIVSAYLVREGLARDTMEALRVFGELRTANAKGYVCGPVSLPCGLPAMQRVLPVLPIQAGCFITRTRSRLLGLPSTA